MNKITLPYEVLLRYSNGSLAGAHYVEITRYTEDDGTLISEKIGDAQPIPTALSDEILGATNTALLARIAELESELVEARKSNEQAPEELTIRAWQAKAVLEANGLLQAAEAIIDTMPDGIQKIAVQSAWKNNADFPRSSQTIISLAAGLVLTDADLDQMFATAASLTI